MELYTLTTQDETHWRRIVQQCESYDVYHLPEYHKLMEGQEHGQAYLLAVEDESNTIALPLILRPISDIPGLEDTSFYDAGSVYGYVGPIADLKPHSAPVIMEFARHLLHFFHEHNVISFLSRLHPLFKQDEIIRAVGGNIQNVGPTIGIDLTLPLDKQLEQYRLNHRRDIQAAIESGVKCFHDQNWDYFDDFINIYLQTMQRVGASQQYFFSKAHFHQLRELLKEHVHLFPVIQSGKVIAGGLFWSCGPVIQYHLGGTINDYLKLSPAKVMLDTVRQWGCNRGAEVLHLGGGVGSKRDGLFRFKSGFSKKTYNFQTWQMVIDQPKYTKLSRQRTNWFEVQGYSLNEIEYFPKYRTPISSQQ